MKLSIKRKLTIALSLFALGFLPVQGANNTPGNGDGIAIGQGTTASADSVGIGKDFNFRGTPGTATFVGYKAGTVINGGNYGAINLGSNNSILYGTGRMEGYLGFFQQYMKGEDPNDPNRPRRWILISEGGTPQGYGDVTDTSKLPAATLIGTNIKGARTGDTMINSFNYTGPMGEETGIRDGNAPAQSAIINRSVIGVNSFYNGTFVTGIGAYSSATGGYDVNANGFFAKLSSNASVPQNMGAVIGGSLNRSMNTVAESYNGIANGIMGFGNSAKDSNAALLSGVGNRVNNSTRSVEVGQDMGEAGRSVDAMVNKLTSEVFTVDSAGSTLLMGAGNLADYSIGTQVMGNRNVLNATTHSEGTFWVTTVVDGQSKYVSIIGDGNTFKHTSSSSTYASVIGSNNTFESISNSVYMGNGKTYTKAITDSVILGGEGSTDAVKSIVSLGAGSSVSTEGGVALGNKAKATTLLGEIGYDPVTDAPSSETSPTWKATRAAVSIGDVQNGITRQITGVAAGTEDTDMVNVAQLRKLRDEVVRLEEDGDKAHMSLKTDGSIKMTEGTNLEEGAEYTLSLKDLNVDSITYTDNSGTSTTKTILNKQGMTIMKSETEQGPSVTESGVDSAGKKITGVANGTEDSDGINVGQLNAVREKLPDAENAIKSYFHPISNRADKMGAGLAAISALKPLDYSEEDKWNVAAGYGHYKGKSAVALGLYYHRNEEEMMTLSGQAGNGENSFNVSYSFKLGKKSPLSGYKTKTLAAIVQQEAERGEKQDAMLDDHQERLQRLQAQVASLAK